MNADTLGNGAAEHISFVLTAYIIPKVVEHAADNVAGHVMEALEYATNNIAEYVICGAM